MSVTKDMREALRVGSAAPAELHQANAGKALSANIGHNYTPGSITYVPPQGVAKRPMTKAEYVAFHAECCARMSAITKAKNADYTGKGDDPFANFSRVEAMGICTTEQGFLTRMNDKMSRLASFCERGELSVKDESVEDTLLDLANYCILMAGYLKGKR